MSEARAGKVAAADVTPNLRRGGQIRITLSPRTVGATSGFGGVLTLQPGERVIEHYHPYSEEFLHVVAGEAELRIEGETLRLGPGDSAFVPIGARHRMTNTGQTVVQAVFHLSPLAPEPALGHVDCEPPIVTEAPMPDVGGSA